LSGHPVAGTLAGYLSGHLADHLAGYATGDVNRGCAGAARNDRRLLNGSVTIGLNILSGRDMGALARRYRDKRSIAQLRLVRLSKDGTRSSSWPWKLLQPEALAGNLAQTLAGHLAGYSAGHLARHRAGYATEDVNRRRAGAARYAGRRQNGSVNAWCIGRHGTRGPCYVASRTIVGLGVGPGVGLGVGIAVATVAVATVAIAIAIAIHLSTVGVQVFVVGVRRIVGGY